jgi:hypothetical protein
MNILKRAYQSLMRGPIFVIIFGLLFFGIGGGLMVTQYVFKQNAAQTQGVVTGHAMVCDDDGCTYKSVVSFSTSDGEPVSYTSSYSSSPPAHDVGEAVTIFYAPDDPLKANIKGEGIVLRVVFMVIGGVIFIFGLAFFASNIKNSYLAEE